MKSSMQLKKEISFKNVFCNNLIAWTGASTLL